MKKNFMIAIRMTIATTLLLGVVYPFVVTGLAQVLFPKQANGELITVNGKIVGSRLIGQPFSSPGYFRPRPSAAGTGYDAGNSGGSNLGPTNKTLIDRVNGDVQKLQAENPAMPVPMDLVTTSGSGLDPHISPEAAAFQVPRVARERSMTENDVRALIAKHTEGRQFGFLGEPRVNVLELNLDLDAVHPLH
ncbi:MAG: potassium-transporting ATPase subunit KdpC [Acidobacteriia bacterium]|nr:potassium-transporting ATPase subunit KdpC [Terriglobia bacterium]